MIRRVSAEAIIRAAAGGRQAEEGEALLWTGREGWVLGQFGVTLLIDVTRLGAVGDGATDDTGAVLEAVSRAKDSGGAIIYFPPGRVYLVDSVSLDAPNITILAHGATIRKAGGTAYHLFYDDLGKADGLCVLGGTYDLSRGRFEEGQRVSAFHLKRTDMVRFEQIWVKNGIEEGLKLWQCQYVWVAESRFENIRNNGIELHCPPAAAFPGGSTKPDRDSAYLWVHGCKFENINDGKAGTADGQGIAAHASSSTFTTKHVWVEGCLARRCIRGMWAEFNVRLGEDINFDGNSVIESEFHGIGLIGVEGGGARGNTLLDIGTRSPGSGTSDEVFGIIVSGSGSAKSKGLIVTDNVILERRTGASRHMQYGIVARQCDRVLIERNRIEGALVEDVFVDWTLGTAPTNSYIQRLVPPMVKTRLSTTFTVPNGAWTPVEWNLEVFDTNGMWSGTTAVERRRHYLRWPGRYRIKAAINFIDNPNGRRGARIVASDGVADTVIAEHIVAATSGDETSWTMDAGIYDTGSSANRHVRLDVYQNSGAGLAFLANERAWLLTEWFDMGPGGAVLGTPSRQQVIPESIKLLEAWSVTRAQDGFGRPTISEAVKLSEAWSISKAGGIEVLKTWSEALKLGESVPSPTRHLKKPPISESFKLLEAWSKVAEDRNVDKTWSEILKLGESVSKGARRSP